MPALEDVYLHLMEDGRTEELSELGIGMWNVEFMDVTTDADAHHEGISRPGAEPHGAAAGGPGDGDVARAAVRHRAWVSRR